MDRKEQALSYCHRAWQIFCNDKMEQTQIYSSRAISKYPSDANTYVIWGYTLEKERKFDEAISKYKKAIALAPSNSNVYSGCGYVLMLYKEAYEEAVIMFNKAIELNPRYREAYINLGYAYHLQNDFDTAVEIYNKAIQMNPNDGYAYCNVGYTLINKEKPTEEAIKICRVGAQLMKKNPGELEEYKKASYHELEIFEPRLEKLPEGGKKKSLRLKIAALKYLLDILDERPLDDSLLVYD